MIYFEDVFLNFYNAVKHDVRFWPQTEQNAVFNFFKIISQNLQLTEKQANFVIKLIEKHKDVSILNQYDPTDHLKVAVWKNEFRTIDYSKKIFVDNTDDEILICLKFPFSFKQTLESSVKFLSRLVWDNERKINTLNPYEINLIELNEFCKLHEFEIDLSFQEIVSEYEEILNQQETIYPHFIIKNKNVVLKNCGEDTVTYYEENKTSNLKNNLILLKTMGIIQLNNNSKDMFSKISSSSTNQFYINDFANYFELVEHINHKAVVVLYDDENTLSWLKKFHNVALEANFSKSIKVGFREKAGSAVNDWIKETNLGGSIETGDILIFKNKIPKWIFTKQIKIDVFSTNDLIPTRNGIIKQMVRHMPIVVHIAEYEPTTWRDQKIVNL